MTKSYIPETYVPVTIYLTLKQKNWLEDLGDDLRSDISDAVRIITDQHIKYDKEAVDHLPQIPAILGNAESLLSCRSGYACLSKLGIVLQKAAEAAKDEPGANRSRHVQLSFKKMKEGKL